MPKAITHTDYLAINSALADRLYLRHLPFLRDAPSAVECDCLRRIRYALRDYYLTGNPRPIYEEPQ